VYCRIIQPLIHQKPRPEMLKIALWTMDAVEWLRKNRDAIMNDYVSVNQMADGKKDQFINRYLAGDYLEALEADFLLSRRQSNYLIAHYTTAAERKTRRKIIKRKGGKYYDTHKRNTRKGKTINCFEGAEFEDDDTIPDAPSGVVISSPASTFTKSSIIGDS
jgi:hypothetical protein